MTSYRSLTPAQTAELHECLTMVTGDINTSEPMMYALEILEEAKIEPEPEPLRGLLATVYRDAGPDCSNGGISSRCDTVVVVGPGVPGVFPASEDCPAVEIGTVEFNGETTYHLRPAGQPGKQYMAGGAFVSTSDSRFRALFPFYGAVPLHDRHEG